MVIAMLTAASCYLYDFTTDATIGFIDPPYSVNENSGQVLIPVGVLNGTLGIDVVVSFSTSDSTAIGWPQIN